MELCKGLNHVESMHVHYSSVDGQLWAKMFKLRSQNRRAVQFPKIQPLYPPKKTMQPSTVDAPKWKSYLPLRGVEKGTPPTLLVEMQIDAVAMKNSMEVP